MIKDYFKLQLLMTNRKIKEAGLDPVFGYVLGLAFFFLLSAYAFQNTRYASYLLILTCLTFQFRLSETNRTDFLRSTFGDQNKRYIRIIENLIVCLPFVCILAYHSFVLEGGCLFLGSIVLALGSFHSRLNLTIPTPFSKRPFEFSTGFRKTYLLLLLAYALTVVAIAVGNLNLGMFALSLIFLTAATYFSKPEQAYYVWIHAATPRVFLKDKLRNAFTNVTFLASPILIGLLLFYWEDFELILAVFLMGLLLLGTVILAKYAAYPAEMGLPEGFLIALGLCFPPLVLAIIPFFYSKSIGKLKKILNDND